MHRMAGLGEAERGSDGGNGGGGGVGDDAGGGEGSGDGGGDGDGGGGDADGRTGARRRRSDAGPRRGAEAIGVTSGDAAEARVAVVVATEAPARATEATAVTAVTAATANGMVVDACRAAKQSRSTSARVRKEMDGRRGGGGEDVKGT